MPVVTFVELDSEQLEQIHSAKGFSYDNVSMKNGKLALWEPEKLLETSEYVLHNLILGWR